MTTAKEPVARIRIWLIAEALKALDELQTHSSASKTDLMNVGVQWLAFIESEKRAGNQLLIRRPDGTQYVVETL